MELIAGKVYEPTHEDLGAVPEEVRRQMFDGGFLRPARYDGGGRWHVFTDQELNLWDRERLAKEAPKIIEESITTLPRLDLGCGWCPRDGFEGVDLIAKEATHKVDLFKFPWPWADDSVEELYTAHFLEHVPAREVEERDLVEDTERARRFLGQDMLFAFWDECWRILRMGGKLFIVVPSATSDRGFQDPTHRRFFVYQTFDYMMKKGRIDMGVGHYKLRCNFERTQLTPAGPTEINMMHPLAAARRFNELRNTVYEWHVSMKKIPE